MRKLFVAASIAVLLVGCAPVKHVPVVVNPVPLSAPPPKFPLRAMYLHQQGTVLLFVQVGKDGLPKDIKIIQGSGFNSLDGAALKGVAYWTFRPKTIDGVPVEAYVKIPVNFSMPYAVPPSDPAPPSASMPAPI
jgi:TonB family protein